MEQRDFPEACGVVDEGAVRQLICSCVRSSALSLGRDVCVYLSYTWELATSSISERHKTMAT